MRPASVVTAVLAAVLFVSPSVEAANPGHDPNAFGIETLSTQPHLVSGGDVLLRISVPKQIALGDARVTLNGADITSTFRVMNSFPDVTTGVVTLHDARLLDVFFNETAPGQFTVDQQKAISGLSQHAEIVFLSRSAGTSALRLDPTAVFNPVVPVELRYHPDTNPDGARATIYDHTVNVYGMLEDGFARRPLDNVGVQYGLKALNDGVVAVDQFLDLNEYIGGVDIDFKNTPQRTVAIRPPCAQGRCQQAG
ncbi:MAG: hypothetical protein HY521_15220 [Proteobacteria bacterium]|nr:hypothetical protein [Pseudomonadota bacterium]